MRQVLSENNHLSGLQNNLNVSVRGRVHECRLLEVGTAIVKCILVTIVQLENWLFSESWTLKGLISKRPPSGIQSELSGTILNFSNASLY